MFDKREDHNIKNIKKIIEFLKETKCKYLASLHFKNQFISQNVEDLKNWLPNYEVYLDYTCFLGI